MTERSETLQIMPREMRMMSERILSLTSLPKGFVLMAIDVAMYSQAMGLGGFKLLEQRIEGLKTASPSKLTLTGDDDGTAILDCAGQHAWIAVHSAIDLLDMQLVDRTQAELSVVNVADSEELGIAVALARRSRLDLTFDGHVARARLAASDHDPVLERLLQDGCRMPAELWWRIYDLAQTALVPESVVSRRHAGPIIVTDDGRVIGRLDNDEDTDLSYIGNGAPEKPRDNKPKPKDREAQS